MQAIDWMVATPPYRSLWDRQEVSADLIAKELDHYYVGQISKVPIVTFMLTQSDDLYWPDAHDSALYIHRIAVAREATAHVTGQSILPEVFHFCADIARECGARMLRLDCDKTRPSLGHIYEKQGFVYHSDIELPNYQGARYQRLL